MRSLILFHLSGKIKTLEPKGQNTRPLGVKHSSLRGQTLGRFFSDKYVNKTDTPYYKRKEGEISGLNRFSIIKK